MEIFRKYRNLEKDIEDIMHFYGRSLQEYSLMPIPSDSNYSLQNERLIIKKFNGKTLLLLPNDRTAYSKFKIPLTVDEYFTSNIQQDSPLTKLHICMLNKYCYETLDKCLRDIMRHASIVNGECPFRRKIVVLGGDFR
ncbi:hypothetical protein Ahy_A02g007123 [Arachis hypogaea]|uniref:ATP-dependent DNA helicase n=1 Tax=Arachis hypogaea TaxID=3818 RepID=A0A445EBT8_ARAHY|nr:hypothetical protein Ahy_A02g007123 [Arachis hypogaea]